MIGGILPELGNLSNVKTLRLWENRLSGSIPAELGNLTSLGSLALSSNRLSGGIPSELGNLGGIKILDLTANQLTGRYPPSLEASLTWRSCSSGETGSPGVYQRACETSRPTTWTGWDFPTVARLSHSPSPARATFTSRDKVAWGLAVGTLLARSLGTVTFSSLQAHRPRVPQFL